MNALKINNLNLTCKNGHKAVNGISLEIKNGMFGLLGPNGVGKSSLMKTIVGLQKPTSFGLLSLMIQKLQNKQILSKKLGFLPQDFGVYLKVNAYDLLNHIAILKGVSNKTERQNQIQYL